MQYGEPFMDNLGVNTHCNDFVAHRMLNSGM
jgi:hypothetical protein